MVALLEIPAFLICRKHGDAPTREQYFLTLKFFFFKSAVVVFLVFIDQKSLTYFDLIMTFS